MNEFWYLFVGMFIGGIGTLILMSMLEAASRADDISLGDKQYEE